MNASSFLSGRRWAAALTSLVASAALTGCYVMPMQPPGPAIITVPAPAPAAPVTFMARLYPANDLASSYGMVAAVVTNDLNGRGRFSTNINGETFSGEATRVGGSSRDGVANGAGSRGGYIQCRYTMNSSTLGTGNCRLANGAAFTMHLGS
jgi:hypothetical protein